MASPPKEPEEKLRQLGERLRRGWAKLYPVTEKELSVVRQVVREQWEQKHQARETTEVKKSATKSQQAKTQSKSATAQTRQRSASSRSQPSQTKTKSQSHGQSQ